MSSFQFLIEDDVLKYVVREVLYTKDAQPFLIAGSGTLGWDQVAANLVEPGENALVLHSGYFGDSFEDWCETLSFYEPAFSCYKTSLQTYGANVDQIKAEIGAAVSQSEIEKALKSKKYKVLTFTHVDTSTGKYTSVDLLFFTRNNDLLPLAVLSDAKAITETVKRFSPETLV